MLVAWFLAHFSRSPRGTVRATTAFMLDEDLTKRLIGAAIDIHRHFGPGMFEKPYELCYAQRLSELGIAYRRQVQIPVTYKGVHVIAAIKRIS